MYEISNKNEIIEVTERKNANIKLVKDVDEFEVIGWLKWKNGFPTMFENECEDAEKVVVKFNRMNHGMWLYIEENILEVNEGLVEKDVQITYNFMKMRSFIIKWLLKEWNLPIELEKGNCGELTDDSYEKVMSMFPSILNYFVNYVENRLFLFESERKEISKQCLKLFGPRSIGVNNPHEAVSLYCGYASFWEKFGLNYFDLQRLPQDLYVKLKTVMSNEIDIKNQQTENLTKNNNQPKSNVRFGRRGSKGKTTPLMRA